MSQPKKLIRKVVKGKPLRVAEQGFRKSRGLAWRTRYGFPARDMKVVAVTGTNGKTTTVSYINEVIKAGGLKTAVLSTAYYEIAGDRRPNRTHQTIDKQSIVQKFFADAKKAKVDWVILEVTSHALDQKRVDGIPIEIAVMTNLSQDHLDYHKTMERYAAAKALLFNSHTSPKYSILNADDEWYKFYDDQAVGTVVAYGKSSGVDYEITEVKSAESGSRFAIKHGTNRHNFTTRLVGEFNVYNAAAAIGVGESIGLDFDQIAKGVENLRNVPGRMEDIDAGQDFKVLVDFAYTPDALENALSSLQQITSGKVRIVFGATGDRDKDKRPLMGDAVANNADAIYLTDDETYTEDAKAIRDAVYEGIVRSAGADKTKVFDDRLDAIKQAFNDAKKGDTVLLTGIGHEDYRNMGGQKLPWNESEIAIKLLAKYQKL